MRTSVVPPYSCYLRVYEPVAAFGRDERELLAPWLEGVERPSTAALTVAEQRVWLAALLPAFPSDAMMTERRAYVVEVDGVRFVCPDEPALRIRQALRDLVSVLSDDVLRVLIPAGGLDGVDFSVLCEDDAGKDDFPHILTARWHVPLAWFVIFSEDQRTVRTEPERSLRYLTPMVDARRRIARAYRLLRRTWPDWDLGALVDLGRWLEAFHPHAWVELDYGGLVHLVSPEALAEDQSAKDVTAALQAVAEGNDEEALIVYRRLRKRWWSVRAKERAS
ncbi:hypothetical protein [Thermasporomyces composti]|uniref:DUF8083 domain-containing protein n=1 Tax=Thermasporomyces composti TaxID=696763 RepID=A0A3D9VCA2_THECX|nr:hypothetical protein [Thermasporomyces composti]REF36695.1 hypothetical protein DFJ64_2115 [Thermasporomyces composti]